MFLANWKYGFKKAFISILMFCICITMLFNSNVIMGMERVENEPMVSNKQITGNNVLATQQGDLSLWVNAEDGSFEVRKEKGTVWKSNCFIEEENKRTTAIWKNSLKSQLLVYYSASNGKFNDSVNSYTYSVRKDGLAVYEMMNGFAGKYYFPDIEATIWMYVQLKDGYIDVTIPYEKMEFESLNMLVTEIEVLPFFGAKKSEENGFMIVPDGSGGIINLDKAPTTSNYSVSVYGEDETFKSKKISEYLQKSVMPIYGLNSQTGSFFTVITKGETIATINAYTAGNKTSYNNIYTRFKLRATDEFSTIDWSGQNRVTPILDTKDLNYKDLSQRYYLLDSSSSYSDMAKLYRQHLLENGLINTNYQSGGTAVALELYGAVQKKEPILGIPFSVQKTLTTYKQATEIVSYFKTGGVDNPLLIYKNATKAIVKNKALSRGEHYKQLGSQKELLALKELVGAGNLFIECDPFSVKKSNFAFWNIGKIVTNLKGSPSYRYRYDYASGMADESTRLTLHNLATANKALGKYLKYIEKTSSETIFIEGIGRSLYSDFGKNRANREDVKTAFELMLEDTKNLTTMVDTGNAYTWNMADWIVNLTSRAGSNVLIDYEVPIVQMVLCGYLDYTTAPINLSSNIQRSFLKAIESRSTITFSFISESVETIKNTELSNKYALDFELWKFEALEMMIQQGELFATTKSAKISKHEYIKDNLVRVKYDNDATIYINYSDREEQIDSIVVPAMNFVIT